MGRIEQQKELVKIDAILEKYGLQKTSLRRSVMMIFLKNKKSLSQADLIEALSKTLDAVDRVSVYRTLMKLKEVGALHEVEANSYVFCSHDCEEHAHLLLFCQKCHRHQEIKDHDRIDHFMSALGGFRFFDKKQPVFLRGTCSGCH